MEKLFLLVFIFILQQLGCAFVAQVGTLSPGSRGYITLPAHASPHQGYPTWRSTDISRNSDLGPVLSRHLLKQNPLLTHDQEIALGRRVNRLVAAENAAADMAAQLGRDLSASEWAYAAGCTGGPSELFQLLKHGREAKQELIVSNLRLVLSVAYKFRNRGAALPDLVQEGVVALSRAAEKYEPDKGFRFSTYATWWVRQRISRCAVSPNTLSRVPDRMQNLARKAGAVSQRLETLLGREPMTEELARELQCSVKDLVLARTALNQVHSMDYSFGTCIKCPASEHNPEEIIEMLSLRESLEEVMESTLSERERAILRMRCGLDDGRGKSFREIGDALGYPYPKIRRAEQRAFGKLRRTVIGVGLKAYLSEG